MWKTFYDGNKKVLSKRTRSGHECQLRCVQPGDRWRHGQWTVWIDGVERTRKSIYGSKNAKRALGQMLAGEKVKAAREAARAAA